jgi:phage tail sheath protein FI
MISSIKTPGVYVFEKDGFPPSIAQVATAIPAFIGYTQYGPTIPTKVTSLLEYEEQFGGAPEPKSITINIATETYDVAQSNFKLYNSLRVFYANGGGECYIVSIGNYGETLDDTTPTTTFTDGIDLLEKYDEPTLLLFPDGINLGATNLGLVQQHALMQCADLMDRFTIMDVIQVDGAGLDSDSAAFRDATGNQNLKYGASYYPYLKTNFGYQFRLKQIEAGGVDFNTMYSSDVTISGLLTDFDSLHTDVNDVGGVFASWTTAKAANTKDNIAGTEANVAPYLTKIWNLLAVLGDPTADLTNTGLQTFVNGIIPVSLTAFAQQLVDFNIAYDVLTGTTAIDLSTINGDYTGVWGDVNDNGLAGDYPESTPNPFTNQINDNGTPTDPDFNKIQAHLDKLHSQVVTAMDSIMNSIEDYELKIENDLTSQLPIYPSILAGLSQSMNTVPPSGAIAGAYANTDARRGVWKAPANVSVAGIIGLTDDINDKEQENMNIHESGKSINAIRKFTGKGLLVWGARTLDGNSNDWRYINVRRLANMIEESAKKACMNFVFEPNVKQTWVNVKGMIDNYLTTLWGDGALAGAKPADAFYVSVGLNATMTAQDILAGRMIVLIGLAMVRPAEFIVLEFTQTQQRS